MLGEADERLLNEALRDKLVLVTFDLATIPPLLQEMAVTGRNHGGVIFISSRSFPQNDLTGIASALKALHKSSGRTDWKNRAVFLSKPPK